MSEIEDVNFKPRIIVKFFVKQDSLNKEIREQLLNSVQYAENAVEMFWLLKAKWIMVMFLDLLGVGMVEWVLAGKLSLWILNENSANLQRAHGL